LLRPSTGGKTIVVSGVTASARRIRALKERGVEVWRLPLRSGGMPWNLLLARLAQVGVMSVMIEGGAVTATHALRRRVVDRVFLFYAPKIIGGDGMPMIASLGVTEVAAALKVKNPTIATFGEDFLVSADL
jgi:diaminohydroxyphosphoribosylaminopyrimidine deaminase/5-amino-6-(5-phosphoribosylamino)uracil reductase